MEPGFEIGKDGIGSLVVGFDGSPPSRDALAYASGIARREGARLLVAFVSSVSGVMPLGTEVVLLPEYAGDDLVDQLHAEVAAELDDCGVVWEFVHRTGDPVRELERLAEEIRADGIVVGRSHTRVHSLIGSVPVRLIKRARCPIIVAP